MTAKTKTDYERLFEIVIANFAVLVMAMVPWVAETVKITAVPEDEPVEPADINEPMLLAN